MTITNSSKGGSMNTFHEINIFTSGGDFKSALVLLKNRTESVARKILKKAGYSVPDIYGRSFWIYVQNTIMQAARNRTSGYSIPTKALPTPCEDNCIPSANVQEQTLCGSASTGNAPQDLLSEKNISDSGCSTPELHAEMRISQKCGIKGEPAVMTPVEHLLSDRFSQNRNTINRTSNLEAGNANQVATGIPQFIGIHENDKLKINKYTVLAKIALLWTSFYILFLLPSIFFGEIFTLLNGSFALTYLVIIYLTFYCIHHYSANKNREKKIILTFCKKHGVYHAGIPISLYMPKNRHRIVTLLVKATCEQFQKENIPVMMRSHFLNSPDRFMKKMRKNNIFCAEISRPEVPTGWRKFMLYWVTPVIIGSFQWYIPTINLRETEMTLTRGPDFEKNEITVNTYRH